MKIIFNLVKCGLANNGGSQTLIRSAMELKRLGNEVVILLDKENRFTWFEFDNSIIKYVEPSLDVSGWPKCDIIMATACSTVNDTLTYPYTELSRKFYWVRAIETWAMPILKLKEGYMSGLKIICNSEWQCRFLHRIGVDSLIQYPGIPIELIENINSKINIKSRRNTVGALLSTKTRKCPERLIEICNLAYDHGIISHVNLLSNEDNNIYIKNLRSPYTLFVRPSFDEKIKMMNECLVWLATTDNEGLHIPPMEAGLSGCNIVCNNMSSAGMGDYAINEFSSLNFTTNEMAVECIRRYVDSNELRTKHMNHLRSVIINKIGNIEDNMKLLEKKMRIACGNTHYENP